MAKRKESYVSKKFKNLLHIYVATFTRNIYYINTKSLKKYKAILLEQLGLDVSHLTFNEFADGNFSVYKDHDGIPIGIIRAKKEDIPVLVHECLHATFWIMENVGIELCEKSEEVYCYTQMLILNEIINSK